MSLDRRPTKKTVEALRLALTATGDAWADKQAALEIWKGFRWQIKIMPERTYEGIEKLIDQAIDGCQTTLQTEEVKKPMIQRFTEMKNRISEFMVEPEENEN
jgi:hypothetical protein